MIGSKKIVLTGRDFLRGMISGTYNDDGFFSDNTSGGVNLIGSPGVVYPQQGATDITPASVGEFAAGCKGGGASAALGYKNNYFVTVAGKFYSYNGTSLTNDANGTNIYSNPKTDIIFYKETVYATSTSNITKATMSGYNISSVNESWWTSTMGKGSLSSVVPHPMLVFEDILWIGDSQYLHKWDNTTATSQAFTMTDDQNITALAVDPGSGKMMIATTQGANGSATTPRINKISLWDGYSNKVLRSVIVDDMVTAMYSVGGTVYITYGNKLGYWNGSGISWLRTLKNVAYSGYRLAYKNHITAQGNRLYVVDGTLILAYHSVTPGSPKIFYYAWAQTTHIVSQVVTLSMIIDLGEDYLGIAYVGNGTTYFMKAQMQTVTAGSSVDAYTTWRTKYFVFDEPVNVVAIKVFFDNPIEVNKSPVGMSLYGGEFGDAIVFTNSYNNFSSKTPYVLDYKPRNNSDLKLHDFYLYIYDGDTAYSVGIRKIIIYYNPVLSQS